MSSGRKDEIGGGESGRSDLGSSSRSGGGPEPNDVEPLTQDETKLLRINTTGHLKPAPHDHDAGNQPPSPNRPVTPTVQEEDPSGKARILHRDGDADSRTGRHDEIYQNRDRSGSESSFTSIKTIEDLGFTSHVAASDVAIREASAALSPRAAQHGLSNSDPGPVHHYDGSDGKTLQECLCGDLRDRYMVKSKALQCYKKKFLPISDIKRVVSTENVQQVLAQEMDDLSNEEVDRLSQEICSGGLSRCRVFALLLLGEQTKCTRCFVDCKFDDTDLPFLKEDSSSHEVYSTKNAGRRLRCFKTCGWKRRDLDWLLEHQHAVAAPIFDFSPKKLLLYDLPEGTVLPFTKYEVVDEGGFATVFKVAIHPDHHNSPAQGEPEVQYFAIKALNSQNREEYKKEVEVLQRFSGKHDGHDHLIRLLLTYMFKHKGSYHMIFPWADGGNLQNLWENMQPEPTQPFVCWMLSQYHGIADGLREIHGSNHNLSADDRDQLLGRHGDIKAENILWFKDYKGNKNHLRISDFGLTRYHRLKSVSAEDMAPGWSPSYRPPECALPGVSISLEYDMWTLGCLLLDFLSWYLLGWESIEKDFPNARLSDEGWTPDTRKGDGQPEEWFREERYFEDKFFQQERDRDGANVVLRLKPSVTKWIQKLHGLPNCPEFAHDVLNLIHKGLLHPDKRKRWKSQRVVDELKGIWSRCEERKAYCCDPKPWKRPSIEVYIVQYKTTAIESMAAKLHAEVPSPGSLSPASGPSRASTPPLDRQSPSQSQEDLQPRSQEPPAAAVDQPPKERPPTQDPDTLTSQVEGGESSHVAQHTRRETDGSLVASTTRATGFSAGSSAPLIGRRGDRQLQEARVGERNNNRWASIKQRARSIFCPCF